MWSTLPYLVKVQICFALLWIVYRFFLQRDGRFARSRAYLLLSVPVSFLIPLLSIPVLPASQPAPVPAVPVAAVAEAPVRAQPVSVAEDASLFAEAAPAALSASPAPSPASGAAPAMTAVTVASPGAQASAFFREAAASAFAALVPAGWSGLMYAWLLWCGIAGSLLLLLYYLGHTLRWVRLMREGNVSRMLDDVRVVYSPAVSSPCSLFNCIFINRRDLGENEFRELMAHELCHIRLRHSWDRLLAVVVTLFCWWNPFVWLWHRSLCEVHEYQADDAVLQCGFDAEQYIMLMVSSVAGARTTLASGFSYSLVRKRLQMLSRGASRRAGLRMLLVVPALAVLLALFSFTERPVAAGSPEQVPAELSDQLLSAFGYSADAVPAAVQAQTAAEEGPILFSGDDTVPSDDAEPTAAVQPGAAFADASGVSGYGAPVSGGAPAVQRVSSKGDDVVIMVDGKVDPRGVQALNELDPSDVERITVGTKDSPVVMVTTKRYLRDYPEEAAAIRKREGDFGVREFLNASAEDPQASAGSRAGGSVPVKADGWDEAIEAAAAAIEQSALKLASSTLDLTANALGAASSGSAVSSRGRTSASGDVSRAKPEAARVEEDIAKAKADIERAKTEVVAEAARLRKQLDDDTSRWAGTFAGQYAGDSRETSKSHVQDNMVRLTRFAGQTITGVSASSGFSVEVRESNSTSVEIVMPAEWQQYLTCELTPDGVVQLGLDTKRLSGSRGLRINKGQLTAVVSLPKLSLLKCSSGAVIRCTGIFKGGTVQLRASSGGMVDGLSLKASEALIDASSGGGIRNVAVTAPKAGVEISSGAVVKGVSLDVAALTCQASSGAVATLEHTGDNSMLNTSSGGVIRITGSTRILTVNKSRSGGNINTDGYTVSYRVQ